jgi:hypothetical protein
MYRLKGWLKEVLIRSGWRDEMKDYIERKKSRMEKGFLSVLWMLNRENRVFFIYIELLGQQQEEDNTTTMTVTELSKASLSHAYG